MYKGNVLLILKELKHNFSQGCADVKDFSFFEDEEEVLVFPFTCFSIVSIEEENLNNKKNYIIHLDYIDKYKSLFGDKSPEELIKEIPNDSNFVNDIFNTNIIDEKYRKVIIATYKIDQTKIKIWGENFVINNKNNCSLMYNELEFELKEYFDKNEIKNDTDELIIKIILKHDIKDLSYMFDHCSNLLMLNESLYIQSNIISNMKYMFNECTSLDNISCISKWDLSHVTDMSYMLYNCLELVIIEDISKWNTLNVTNMSHMFSNCTSLECLPDISNWNVSKVVNANGIFYCDSNVPNFKGWEKKFDLYAKE